MLKPWLTNYCLRELRTMQTQTMEKERDIEKMQARLHRLQSLLYNLTIRLSCLRMPLLILRDPQTTLKRCPEAWLLVLAMAGSVVCIRRILCWSTHASQLDSVWLALPLHCISFAFHFWKVSLMAFIYWLRFAIGNTNNCERCASLRRHRWHALVRFFDFFRLLPFCKEKAKLLKDHVDDTGGRS